MTDLDDRFICNQCGKYFDKNTGETCTDWIVEKQRDRHNKLCKKCFGPNYAPITEEPT